MSRWIGYERGQSRKYEKIIRFYNTYTEKTYKTTLSIELYNEETDDRIVKSINIGTNRLDLWQVSGEDYKAIIFGKNKIKPMENKELKYFFHEVVIPELDNFPKAKIKGKTPNGEKKNNYLLSLRNIISDDIEWYDDLVTDAST